MAKLSTIANPSGSADYAVMVREGLAANTRMALLKFQGDVAWFGSRTSAGTNVVWSNAGPTLYGDRWLKLVRSGDTITGFVSIDGVTWGSAVGSGSISVLANSVSIKLAVDSSSNRSATTANFYNPTILSNASDFYLVPMTSSQTLPQGAASSYPMVWVGSISGFSGTVNMSLSLPAGATYTPSTISVARGGYVNLQIDLPGGSCSRTVHRDDLSIKLRSPSFVS